MKQKPIPWLVSLWLLAVAGPLIARISRDSFSGIQLLARAGRAW